MRFHLIEYAGIFFTLMVYSAGCAAHLSPVEVCEGFWQGIKDRDAAAVARHVTSSSLPSLKLRNSPADILTINKVSLGRTVIDGDQAWVDTQVELAADDPFQLPLKTVLQQENQQWKVDYDATVSPITRGGSVALVIGGLSDLSRQFADELDRSLEEIQRTLPQIQEEIGRAEEELKEKLPVLRQRIDAIMRQLEDALGNQGTPQPPSRSAPHPGTREI
jgi:hypothetical protein